MIKIEPNKYTTGINIQEIYDEVGLNSKGEFITYATTTAYRYMDKYVPKSNGTFQKLTGKYGTSTYLFVPGGMLRENAEFHMLDSKNTYIEYNQPYARYQYYGSQTGIPWNYTTEGTGPYWDINMMTAEGTDYYDELQRYVDKRLK